MMAAAAADDGDTSRVIGERCGLDGGGLWRVAVFYLMVARSVAATLKNLEGWLAGVVAGSWQDSPFTAGQLVFVKIVSPMPYFVQYLTSYLYPFYQHNLPSLDLSEDDCELDLHLRQKRGLKYPGASAIEYQGAMRILLESLLAWDSAKQVGKRGVFGILDAYSRADEEQGRGYLHGHWLLWVKLFGRLRDLMHDEDEEIRRCARKELVNYLNMVMSSSYPDGFEVVHCYEGECLADGCDEKAVDGKHFCRSHLGIEPEQSISCDLVRFQDNVTRCLKRECLYTGCDQKADDGKHYCCSHEDLEPTEDKFIDREPAVFRKARHEDGCHEVGGRLMQCKMCKEKGVPDDAEKVIPRDAVWAGLERMHLLPSLPTLLNGRFGEDRARLDVACARHVYDLKYLEKKKAEESHKEDAAELPEGVEDVPLEEDAEFLATFLNPWNNVSPSGNYSWDDRGDRPWMEPVPDLEDRLDEFWKDPSVGQVLLDTFWKDPTVRQVLLRLRYDEHFWEHAKGCFKKGCECRFFFAFLCSLVTNIYDDPGKEEIKRYMLDGKMANVPRYGFQMKRHQGSQYLNTHSVPISNILNCNTNVSTGDIAQLMYQTLYVSKCTQDDDSIPRQQVAARVIRSIHRREELNRTNGVSESERSEPDFVEGLKLMLSAINAATSRDTVSADMAANIVHQKGTRFVHSVGFQPLLLSQMEDELDGVSRKETFTLRYCENKDKSLTFWPDVSANDYCHRPEDLEDMCLFQYTMQYQKFYSKKERQSEEEEERTSNKLRFTSDHPGHKFAYLKPRPKYVIPIVYLPRIDEDEEESKREEFSTQFKNANQEGEAQPGVADITAATMIQGAVAVSVAGDEDDNSGDDGSDVAEDEMSLGGASAEAHKRGHICRVERLMLVEGEDCVPSDEVIEDRERFAKLANMLFCPYRDLGDLKSKAGSFWEKFDEARTVWIKNREEKKNYPCFESRDDWRNQYVGGFWAKGFEILQNMEDNKAAMGANGRTDTFLTRKTKCYETPDGDKKKKKKESDLDNMKDISYFFGEPDDDAPAEVNESAYRYNHRKLVDQNIGISRLLNARLSSNDSIFVQDEPAGTKPKTKKKASNKEADQWKGNSYRTKFKLIAGSLLTGSEYRDTYSSLDSEGKLLFPLHSAPGSLHFWHEPHQSQFLQTSRQAKMAMHLMLQRLQKLQPEFQRYVELRENWQGRRGCILMESSTDCTGNFPAPSC